MRGSFLKFSLTIILFLGILLSADFSIGAMETTVKEIVANKDSYNGKAVSVAGAISANIKFKTSKGGKDYTTFSLIGDSGGYVNVFIWGRLKLLTGQKVQVTGIYRKIMRVDQRIYYHLIDASEVK